MSGKLAGVRSAFTACLRRSGWNAGAYYDIVESTQKGDLDITRSGCPTQGRLLEEHAGGRLNDRRRVMINRMLDGFDGNLTNSKWASIEKCSADTAFCDITDLVEQGILQKDPVGGRSTNYSLTH
jgi:hypothetical protein